MLWLWRGPAAAAAIQPPAGAEGHSSQRLKTTVPGILLVLHPRGMGLISPIGWTGLNSIRWTALLIQSIAPKMTLSSPLPQLGITGMSPLSVFVPTLSLTSSLCLTMRATGPIITGPSHSSVSRTETQAWGCPRARPSAQYTMRAHQCVLN